MSEPDRPATSNPRYVLYDFDADQLLTKQIFDTYDQAADAADQLQDVLIVPILISTPDNAMSDTEESAD